MPVSTVNPHFFESAAACRRWLEAHHASKREAWFGFYRKGTGRGGVTYSEALDEALCFGWIDGVRRRFDDVSFVQRFTPRKPRSRWSRVNVARTQVLILQRRMTPAGRAAFEARIEHHPIAYGNDAGPRRLPATYRAKFMANVRAGAFFEAQPPGYRRLALHWVLSAKQEATRLRRFSQLIECSARGERIPQLLSTPRRKK